MSDRAQRVLDALMEYDADKGSGYPIISICKFFDDENVESIYEDTDEDYQELSADEEKQVIQAFLEIAY